MLQPPLPGASFICTLPVVPQIMEFFEHDLGDIIGRPDSTGIAVIEYDEAPVGRRPVLDQFSSFGAHGVSIALGQSRLNVHCCQKASLPRETSADVLYPV